MTLYDTDSFLRGLDNGNRRGYIRNKRKRYAQTAAIFGIGFAAGILTLAEITAYVGR
jgi:hypothetical protein